MCVLTRPAIGNLLRSCIGEERDGFSLFFRCLFGRLCPFDGKLKGLVCHMFC